MSNVDRVPPGFGHTWNEEDNEEGADEPVEGRGLAEDTEPMAMPGGRADSSVGAGAMERASRVIASLAERFGELRAGVLIDVEELVVERTWALGSADPEPYVSMARADARRLRASGELDSGSSDPASFSLAVRTSRMIQYSARFDVGAGPFLLSVAVGRGAVNLELLRRTLVDALDSSGVG